MADVRYIKLYHDNVDRRVKRYELYMSKDVLQALDYITGNIIDSLTNYPGIDEIDRALSLIKDLQINYDDLDYELYDSIIDVIDSHITLTLWKYLEEIGEIDGGDYSIIREVIDYEED